MTDNTNSSEQPAFESTKPAPVRRQPPAPEAAAAAPVAQPKPAAKAAPKQAKHAPVRQPQRQLDPDQMPVGQKASIDLDRDFDDRAPEVIEVVDAERLQKEHLDALAFMEEPVTILVHPQHGENAPLVVDCWVQGKGAEILFDKRWVEFRCIPVNKPVTTKRKYVEALAMSKITRVKTQHEDATVEKPKNELIRTTSSAAAFSILHDPSPLGREWAIRVFALAN